MRVVGNLIVMSEWRSVLLVPIKKRGETRGIAKAELELSPNSFFAMFIQATQGA